jgi:hypothetical protein
VVVLDGETGKLPVENEQVIVLARDVGMELHGCLRYLMGMLALQNTSSACAVYTNTKIIVAV